MAVATNRRSAPVLRTRVETQRCADILIDVLIKSGVEVIFGIPGGAIVALNDALLDRPEIRMVTTRHESGAMFAAAGYAHATGKLGVVMVTSGPGALNCMTGIASAHCDSLPILILAGEVPRQLFGKGALQEGSSAHLNIIGMAKHVTKLAVEVATPDVAPAVLRRAISTALSGRPGPVMLTIPLDVGTAFVRRPGISSHVQVVHDLDAQLMSKVARTLSEAERPVLFAGSGTRSGSGALRLRELAERLQAPVMTTPKAKGVFPESHPLSLGVFGHGGHPSTTKYLSEDIDVLVAVGTGLTDTATNGWSALLQPTKHFIQVDIDVMRMGTNYPVSVGLVGPADCILGRIVEELPNRPRMAKQFDIETFSDPTRVREGEEKRIAPQRALWELQAVMPPSTVYSCDIGEHLLFATHYLRIDDPRGFLIMTGLASMGSGIGGALGSKLGAPNRPVVAVCGDGCFTMSLGDLATAVRERVPIVVAVLNDARYGMVELGHLALYGRTPQYASREINVAQLAEGVGARAVVIKRSDEILGLDLQQLLEQGPVVLDVRIDRSFKMPKNKRFEELLKVTSQSVRAPAR